MQCASETTRFASEVIQFRARRAGPELAIQDAVADAIPTFFSSKDESIWAAASLPVGAGMPDLIAASYSPHVSGLREISNSSPHVLAYLRAFGKVRAETISERTGVPRRKLDRQLSDLSEAEIVHAPTSGTFQLSPQWRGILSEIIAIEVKVSDWQRAIRQAARNRVFCTQSYVALPTDIANRVRREPAFVQTGLGLLSISKSNSVTMARKAVRQKPLVWAYYYHVALTLAKSLV
jgi:hypothetical protein